MFWNRKKKQQEPKPKSSKPFDFYGFMDGIGMDGTASLQEYNLSHAIPKRAPVPEGVAMDSCAPVAQVNYDAVNPVVFAHYVATGQFIGYPAMAVISQHWLVRKGCESKPRDALRKWYEIGCEGDDLHPDQIKEIETLDRKYGLKKQVLEAATMNNIFGIRHVLFLHSDPAFDYSKPFNPSEFEDGKYAGISQIDPNRLTPEFENKNLTDPSEPNYLEPTWWQVGNKRIHKSHMVILTGDMVPDLLKPTYRYGGISKVQKVYERVYAAERTANEAPQLTMTKRLVWRKADLEQVASKPTKFGRAMQKLAEFRNNFGVQLLGKDEDMGQMDTTLTDLDSVIMGQYQLVCSILDVPASKLMGTGHSGFSTGDADIDYYIESLEELQANELTEIVLAHYRRLIPAFADDLGISKEASIYPEWNALRVMSDADKAEVNLKNRQADQIAFQSQAIDSYELRERLINDPYSGFDNLEMVEDEDDTDPEAMALDEMAETAEDAEYQGRTVELNKPFRDPDGSGKFGVYVKNDKGNVVKVSFGDKGMEIRRDDPEARKNFRARHNCAEKTDRTKAGYWSCKFWSSKSVSELLGG